MAVYAETKSGFDVAVMKRKARKAWKCFANDPREKSGCLMPNPYIEPGETYMEVYEGDDMFHPLRYHGACAAESWGMTGKTYVVG
jgi:hypothetical protein